MSGKGKRRKQSLAQIEPTRSTREVLAQRWTFESHSGPLPSPEILARFDDVVPGGAERIFAVFEEQARHRMRLERTVVLGDNLRANLGLGLGFVIALVVLFAAVYLGVNGQPVLGGVLGGLDLVSLAGVFVHATNQRRQERAEKAALSRPQR